MMDTAKSRFEKLNGARSEVLERARDAADLTIPSLMPASGHSESSRLPQPYQSLGARGVNNLASKLALALLPAGNPFFRMTVNDDIVGLIDNEPEVQENLRKIENKAMERVENSNLRVILHAALKQLITAGNAMLYLPDEGGARAFRLNQYVITRDPMGAWKEIVIQEKTHPATMDQDLIDNEELGLDPTSDEDVEVYTLVKRMGDKVEFHQEINDVMVPGSEGSTKYDKSPFIPLRWNAVENENYGRGHVEEYMGDLRSLEGLSKAVVEFSAAASRVIFLERPNSTTDIASLVEAQNGEFVEGNPEDIHTLQIDKYPDFQVAKQTIDDLSLRLSHAFLLTTGTVRNAERVTAEEIRLQAQELEDVLGGVYTVLAQELQLPVVRRLLVQLRKSGQIPKLPEGTLSPTIVTGFDALGRGHELNKYRQYFADGQALFGPTFMAQFDPAKVAALMSLHHNIDIDGIMKSQEMVEQEQQQAISQTVIDKAAGPVAGQMAKSMAEG